MLTEQNIEAELSYAYLHAIATRGGFSCSYAHRHLDDAGVDAQVREDGRLLAEDSIHASFTLDVQLKATRVIPIEQDRRFSLDALIAKRCAYWVSLRGAPASENAGHQTVYVPRAQVLSIQSLTEIMTRCSRDEEMNYAG